MSSSKVIIKMINNTSIFIIIIIVTIVNCCHPECSYVCDTPVCHADCRSICSSPQCEVCQYLPQYNTTVCSSANSACKLQCPLDQCESDQCPQCEVTCVDVCHGLPNCSIQCEALDCSWQCFKPKNCPYPICHLQCEQPSCEYSDSSYLSTRFYIRINRIQHFFILFSLFSFICIV